MIRFTFDRRRNATTSWSSSSKMPVSTPTHGSQSISGGAVPRDTKAPHAWVYVFGQPAPTAFTIAPSAVPAKKQERCLGKLMNFGSFPNEQDAGLAHAIAKNKLELTPFSWMVKREEKKRKRDAINARMMVERERTMVEKREEKKWKRKRDAMDARMMVKQEEKKRKRDAIDARMMVEREEKKRKQNAIDARIMVEREEKKRKRDILAAEKEAKAARKDELVEQAILETTETNRLGAQQLVKSIINMKQALHTRTLITRNHFVFDSNPQGSTANKLIRKLRHNSGIGQYGTTCLISIDEELKVTISFSITIIGLCGSVDTQLIPLSKMVVYIDEQVRFADVIVQLVPKLTAVVERGTPKADRNIMMQVL